MDKRVLLTVAISMGILFVWTKFFMPPPPPAAPPAQEQAQPAKEPAPQATAPSEAGQAPEGKPAEPVVEKPAEIVDTVTKPGFYEAKFTSYGAAPRSFVLTDKQYTVKVEGQDKPIDLVRTQPPLLPLTVAFPESDFAIPAGAAWEKVEGSESQLVYAWENERVRVEKRYQFLDDSYEVKLSVLVENKGDKPLRHQLELAMYGWQDPHVEAGGLFSQRAIMTEGMCDLNGKLKDKELQGLLKEPIEATGPVRWVGIDEKYFVSAVATGAQGEDRRCRVSATGDGTITATLRHAPKTLQPKEKATYELATFFGPKILSKLDAVKVGGTDAKLGDAINYGWTEAIARPMLAVLKAVYFVIPNWGAAIIFLTLLLKLLTWWPTQKSMKSMREMTKLKPEIDKLKAKYGDDKQKFNAAVMALYKERGVNPIGGCLPMLIQMPIYIALYSMLGNSVELYHSAFVAWIHDLTAPDPYYVLPLLTGAVMFAQQKTAPTPPDAQQKAMMYMMPLMFTAFSIFLPAGLTLYIFTNTVLTMAQQWWMNRGEPRPHKAAAKPAKA